MWLHISACLVTSYIMPDECGKLYAHDDKRARMLIPSNAKKIAKSHWNGHRFLDILSQNITCHKLQSTQSIPVTLTVHRVFYSSVKYLKSQVIIKSHCEKNKYGRTLLEKGCSCKRPPQADVDHNLTFKSSINNSYEHDSSFGWLYKLLTLHCIESKILSFRLS